MGLRRRSTSQIGWLSTGICLAAILIPVHWRRASTRFFNILLNIVHIFTVLHVFTANVHAVTNKVTCIQMTNVVRVFALTMLNLGSVFQYYCYQHSSRASWIDFWSTVVNENCGDWSYQDDVDQPSEARFGADHVVTWLCVLNNAWMDMLILLYNWYILLLQQDKTSQIVSK